MSGSSFELKPCPFCGSQDIQIDENTSHFHAECGDCGASSFIFGTSLQSAATAWNRRVNEE